MYELLVPAFALGSLYYVNNKEKKGKKEGFYQKKSKLPNTNTPNVNYPSEKLPEFVGSQALDDIYKTDKLSNVNKYNDTGTFTDKYFQIDSNQNSTISSSNVVDSFTSLSGQKVSSDYFRHDNMVPFFGSNSRAQIKDNISNDNILDAYVGSGSQQMRKKRTIFIIRTSRKFSMGSWCS